MSPKAILSGVYSDKKHINHRFWLLLIFLLATGLRAPGWFTEDGKSKYALFEPDEYQHVEIAIYQLQLLDKDLMPEKDVYRFIYNARGFGIQMGIVSYGLYKLGLMELSENNLVVLGRILATFYALLLVYLTFFFAKDLSGDKRTGLLAALLIAVFDLNVTSSHYAIPAVGYVFWTYLSVYWTYRFMFKQEGNLFQQLALPALAAALAFSFKYDFVPILVMGATLLWHFIQDWKSIGKQFLRMSAFIGLMLLSFKLVTFFAFSFAAVKVSFLELYAQNKDVVSGDNQWLHNPILYFWGLLGGTSLLVFLFFWPGLVISLRTKESTQWKTGLLFFSGFLLLELLVRLNIDTPFIRRVNIFLPFVAIVTAWALMRLYRSTRFSVALRITALGTVLIYTLTLTVISQNNFWNDTRYKTRDYIKANYPEAEIKYSPYAWLPGLPKGVKQLEEADLFIMHETFYGRYWKFFTTPFKIPKCCDEVYHCQTEERCHFYQSILKGEDSRLELIKSFETVEVLPERIIFKHLFGTYETFLGDVRIYKVLK